MSGFVDISYAQYINGPEWQAKRELRLRHDSFRCSRCGERERLQVHHVTYERLGAERLEDLLTLCNPCHAREHGRDPDLPGAVPEWFVEERRRDRWRMETEQWDIAIAAGIDLTAWLEGEDA